MRDDPFMAGEAKLTYDDFDNIVYMRFPEPVELSTRQQIVAHFDRVIAFWRLHANGKKAYFVVDFDNITIDPAAMDIYVEQTRRAHDICAIASVRYGGEALQRTVTRLAGIKIHRPSNICDTREQAIAMVRAMQKAEKDASGEEES